MRYLRDILIFAPCYIALDWASYIDPVGPFNITPWNPQPALAIVWMALGGLHYVPAVLASIVAADVSVRGAPGGYLITALTAVALAGGYAWIAWLLRALLMDLRLRSSRDLTVFAVVVAGGTAIVGAAFVGVLRGANLLGATPVPEALLRFWVGDAVGCLVTAPLLLAVADPERRAALLTLARRGETAAQAVVLVATIWLVFEGLGGDPARHFYFLFVPLIWIAARGGMSGAILATAVVQVGVVIAIHREGAAALPVLELQALVAAFTLTGLFLGMVVDERSRAAESLRQSLRLAAAGEMAGAIAHEVMQPLTALGNYGRSALLYLQRGEPAPLAGIVGKMLAEQERTTSVFRAGTTRLEPLTVEALMAAARRIGEQVIGERRIALELSAEPGLPDLYVDRMQVELVLRNLIANAAEALDPRAEDARIEVAAARNDAASVRVVVADNGPGVPELARERLFEPFVSGKSTGMGLGLAVSRAIAEAHGGALEARAAGHGEFHLVLPCVQPG
jgi:two-component system, LuxR family, sensor kinase FixL